MDFKFVKKGQPYPIGVTIRKNGINFSMVNSSEDECGIILYTKDGKEFDRIQLDMNYRIGNISCVFIEGLSADKFDYNFYIGDNIFVDPYARRVIGNEKWKSGANSKLFLRSSFEVEDFDWEDTAPLNIPYSESIFYCLHVRSFTRHKSSKVKNKGTFAGIEEKIPYLKELGITAIELLPCYEFEECEDRVDRYSIEYQVKHIDERLDETGNESDCKLNYWGFKKGYYLAPKASYSSESNPVKEYKHLIRELHKNGIEVIMQFYFPDNIKQGYILEVLKYWILEYRIDGVHLMGNRIPVTLLATEPLFANTKIMCRDFAIDDIYQEGEAPTYKNLGYYREEFMYDTRRFLKGDADMLKGFQYHMKNQNPKCGVVNYMTNYSGFTMWDLVSYERKHNENNNEGNCDGTDYNFSWNCGVEGETRKKSVINLRKKQIKNAFSFLLTAQGTPLILSGDEFGNSQDGNNNCYCHDSEISWLNWNLLKKNEDIYSYVKEMIKFRKNHHMLHMKDELKMTDRFGFGFPDLSYHGEEAWKAALENYNRHIAMMYCGRYAKRDDNTDDDFIYIAYNMHWESHDFALPALPAGYKWSEVLNTKNSGFTSEVTDISQKKISVSDRSVRILIGKK